LLLLCKSTGRDGGGGSVSWQHAQRYGYRCWLPRSHMDGWNSSCDCDCGTKEADTVTRIVLDVYGGGGGGHDPNDNDTVVAESKPWHNITPNHPTDVGRILLTIV
jgi:hypothetical protein